LDYSLFPYLKHLRKQNLIWENKALIGKRALNLEKFPSWEKIVEYGVEGEK